jgi:hypothetical protein
MKKEGRHNLDRDFTDLRDIKDDEAAKKEAQEESIRNEILMQRLEDGKAQMIDFKND